MNEKILLIDDMPFNIRLLKQILEDENYRIYCISEGIDKSIFKKIEDIMPDIIILDIMMPDINGYEICGHIRRHQALCNMPVIILSAMADEVSIKLAFEAGASSFIAKPFNEEEIIDTVREALKSNKSENGADAFYDKGKDRNEGSEKEMNTGEFRPEAFFNKVNRDKNFFAAAVDDFESSSRELLSQIHEALLSREHNRAVKALHALKGLNLYLEADKALELIKAMDTCLKIGENALMEDSFISLKREIENVVFFLRRYLKEQNDNN